MESTGRLTAPTLTEMLKSEPYTFDFFQLTRVWLRWSSQATAFRAFQDGRWPIKFRSRISFSFPASAVHELSIQETESGQVATVLCNFMGLSGHDGPLPDHYGELLLQLIRAKDFRLVEFLDIFHHRLIEQFYCAWEKPRFFVRYERQGFDPVFQAVGALLSVATARARQALPIPAEFAVFYSNLLFRCPVPVGAAATMISEYFGGIPIEILQFEGRWVFLDKESQCELGNDASGSQLGVFCPLGEMVWDVQSQVRLRIGPVDYEDYLAFSPGGDKASALAAVFRYLTASAIEPTMEILLNKTKPWSLDGNPSTAACLGLSMWLGSVQTDTGKKWPERVVFEGAFEPDRGLRAT